VMKLQKEERVLLNGFNQFNLVDEKGLIVGVVAGFTNEQNLQNATLFENAPEMLNMLEKIKKFYDLKAIHEDEYQLKYEIELLLKTVRNNLT
jgi:hypothetical protein